MVRREGVVRPTSCERFELKQGCLTSGIRSLREGDRDDYRGAGAGCDSSTVHRVESTTGHWASWSRHRTAENEEILNCRHPHLAP